MDKTKIFFILIIGLMLIYGFFFHKPDPYWTEEIYFLSVEEYNDILERIDNLEDYRDSEEN